MKKIHHSFLLTSIIAITPTIAMHNIITQQTPTGRQVTIIRPADSTNFAIDIPEYRPFVQAMNEGRPVDVTAYEAAMRRRGQYGSEAHLQQELMFIKLYNLQVQ